MKIHLKMPVPHIKKTTIVTKSCTRDWRRDRLWLEAQSLGRTMAIHTLEKLDQVLKNSIPLMHGERGGSGGARSSVGDQRRDDNQ